MSDKRFHAWEPEPIFNIEKVHYFYVAVSVEQLVAKPGHAADVDRRLTQIRAGDKKNPALQDAAIAVKFECRCPLTPNGQGRKHCDWERSWEQHHSNPEERHPESERYSVTRSVLGTIDLFSRFPLNKVAPELAVKLVRSARSAYMRRSA